MAYWEIRQLDQEPLRIEVEDTRNLAQEFRDAVVRWQSRPWWRFWTPSDAYWHVTPEHELPLAFIAGVLILKRDLSPPDPVVGFRTTNEG